jgi:pSer/pThr/pTyr-binding forkhead associated (FHA) protein
MPRLDLYINYELQATVKLDQPEIRIGRDPACEVQLPDERVSRLHAIISPKQQGHEIEDRSTNGIKVNGVKVEGTQTLNPGDVVFIQSHILMYQSDEAPPEEMAATMLAD